MAAGVERDRVAEVIVEVDAARPGRRGSGYRVTTGTVLTAAHVVVGAARIQVRFNADRPDEWTAAATAEVVDSAGDVAALLIAPPSDAPIAPAPFGRVSDRAASVPCTVVGFPRFKLRADRLGASPDDVDGPGARYRDSHQADGTIPSLSNLREGSLELLVAPPEYSPDAEHSPWEGMSGAAVWSGDRIVGVVSEHHRSDGLNRLAAVRVDRWWDRLPAGELARLRDLLGLPERAQDLVEVTAGRPAFELSSAPAVIPSELPAASRRFVDRVAPFRELRELFDRSADEAGSSPVVVAIVGATGVGKTALALRLAHEVCAGFPDGQLFVTLSDGGTDALSPDAVLGELLRALGTSTLPDGEENRSRLFRSVVARGRYLIMLDDAQDEEQVRSLLPGSAGSAVLLTSRSRLALLDTADTIGLDVLDEPDAVTLLGLLAGPARIAEQADDAARIARSCGGLPLAVRIAGARLASRPQWRLARLADLLTDERRRLKELQMGDAEVRAGFAVSYAALETEGQRLFRLLGLVKLVDFPAWVVAALLDVDLDTAEEYAEGLVEEHLLQAGAAVGDDRARYQFHDLLRAFAAERLDEESDEPERGAALARLLAAGLELAGRADGGLSAANSAVWDHPVGWPLANVTAESLASTAPPLEWFTRERANLLRLLDEAYQQRQWPWVWRLAASLWQYFELTSRWSEWQSAFESAVSAAEQAGDDRARGNSLRLLGRLALARGQVDRADELMTQAETVLREVDDLHGRSMALKDRSVVERLRNHHTRSAELLLTALDGFRRLDEQYWVMIVNRELGIEYRALAQWDQARERFAAAITTFAATNEELQLAATWFELGVLERMQQHWAQAADCLAHAQPEFERLGADGLAVWALREVGLVQSGSGDTDAAAATLERCLTRWEALDDPRQRAATLQELALVRRRQGRPADALALCVEAVGIFDELGDRLSAARTRVTQGASLLDTGDAAAAVSAVAPTVAIFREFEDLTAEVRAQRILADAYRREGDERAAAEATLLADGLAPYARAVDETRV